VSSKQFRRNNFRRWWRKNNKNQKAQDWLTYHSRRVAYGYHMRPGVFDLVQYITKRYFKSEYKRLTERNAWTLWKLIHPLHTERVERMTDTATHLIAAKEELESVKRANKSTFNDKKTVIVERKTRRDIKVPT
jgi:hypothetical protein